MLGLNLNQCSEFIQLPDGMMSSLFFYSVTYEIYQMFLIYPSFIERENK